MNSRTSLKKVCDEIYRHQDFTKPELIIANHRKERESFLECLVRHTEAGQTAHQRAGRVLEIGCGTGIDSLLVAEQTDALAFGIDLSHEALTVAARISKCFANNLVSANADGFYLPFKDSVFDLVFSQGVLEHVPEEKPFLAEQIRVLKNGGILVVNVPQKYTVYTLMKHYRIKRGQWPWGKEKEYNYFQLRSFGKHFDLREIEVFGCRYWLHPIEPAWVLRSLWGKLRKINPWREKSFFEYLGNRYDRFWDAIEKRFGHLFMREIVIVFEKPRREPIDENSGR